MKRWLLAALAAMYSYATVIDDIQLGDKGENRNESVYITHQTDRFSSQTPVIVMTFDFSESEKKPITVRWIAQDAVSIPDYVIAAYTVNVDTAKGHAFAYLEKGPKPWPAGKYRVELVQEGNVLASRRFVIEGKHPSTDTNATLPTLLMAQNVRVQGDKLIPEGVNNRFNASVHLLYALFSYKDKNIGDTVRFEWYYLGEKGKKAPEILAVIEGKLDAPNGTIPGHISLDRDWPKGIYLVKVFINGKEKAGTRYEIY